MDVLVSGPERAPGGPSGRGRRLALVAGAALLLGGALVLQRPDPPAEVPAAPAAAEVPRRLVVTGAGGSARPVGTGAEGVAQVMVTARSGGFEPVEVRVEVPGVRVDPVPLRGVLQPGESLVVAVPFVVPDCALLRRTGRLVVEVRSDGRTTEAGYRLTEDGEARTLRDVDLDVVLDACP